MCVPFKWSFISIESQALGFTKRNFHPRKRSQQKYDWLSLMRFHDDHMSILNILIWRISNGNTHFVECVNCVTILFIFHSQTHKTIEAIFYVRFEWILCSFEEKTYTNSINNRQLQFDIGWMDDLFLSTPTLRTPKQLQIRASIDEFDGTICNRIIVTVWKLWIFP